MDMKLAISFGIILYLAFCLHVGYQAAALEKHVSIAKDMGIPNIRNEENNIHAGAKYMAYLRDNFFNEPEISRDAKWDFTLAGYNAGPNRVQRWRREAKNMGLDPNKWFFNVERVALKDVPDRRE